MTNGKRVSSFMILVVALGAMSAFGCKKKEPEPGTVPGTVPANAPLAEKKIAVTKVELGNELGDDKRVKAPATSFSSKDTIFASVVTEGIGAPAELGAKWTFQDGQVVNETKRAVAPSALAVTEFSIQKPDGWPAGNYKVEISLDGKPVDTKAFRIQ
jgi:hypothetical protein